MEQNPEIVKSRIQSLSDVELKKVLVKRLSYQSMAVDFAVEEAISRGIISHRDEVDQLFPAEEEAGFSLFPMPNNQEGAERMLDSLVRILYILGVIPLVYGVLNLSDSGTISSMLPMFFGAAWIFIAFKIGRDHKAKLVNVLGVFLSLEVLYLFLEIIKISAMKMVDWAILISVVSLTTYLLMYMWRIVKRLAI
ncbi:hypothetical protein EYV94_01905 [Puteibacter caeruleilacunae]|nr:hypothetical protein EYV94_01905 [Puteibacter caeruleilacunae]